MELSPQLRQLRDFYYKTALKLPPGQSMAHAPGLIDKPAFFNLDHLKQQLNNPLLMPGWFTLFWQGNQVDCTRALAHKVIQTAEVQFLNKAIIEEYLSHGASLVLEGLDILDPMINAMCGAIDAPHECVFSNAVAFFSQKGNEAYRGHFDTDDVLVIQLAGSKSWRVHERQAPRRVDGSEMTPAQMGPLQAELTMHAGDALYLRSGTPHSVATPGDYSLHIAFDICDRNVNAETALHLLTKEYDKDATWAYTPTAGVVDKLMALARGESFQRKVTELQAAQQANYKRARAAIGANRISALDRLIALDRTLDRNPPGN
jgi:hypothetical protein